MANTIKKENEVKKVTTLGDTDYVRVTLANGQSGSIKKSDLMPIIKDEIGKLLGNADALSTFTNVLVNNGQTLGKATIENLASVVSGINSDHQIIVSSGSSTSYLKITTKRLGIFIFGQSADRSNIIAEFFSNLVWLDSPTIRNYQIPSFLGTNKYINSLNHILIEIGPWAKFNILSLHDPLTYQVYRESEINLNDWSKL